jgi:hypothetical protein
MAPDVFESMWERVALLGCGVTAAGSVPAWFTLRMDPAFAALVDEPEEISRGGLDGDGILTLTFALVVVAALGYANYRSDTGPGWKPAVVTLLSGIGAAGLAGIAYLDLQSLRDQLAAYEGEGGVNGTLAQNLSVEVNTALYVVIVGGALVVLAGALGTVRELRRADTPGTDADDPA